MSLVTQVSTLATRIGTEFKAIRTLIGGSGTADISSLTTADKTSLVAAINEVKAGNAGAPPDATESTKGVVELASLAETTTGTDAVRAVTPAGVAAVRASLKTEILGGASAAWDTLQEIKALVDSGDAADQTAIGNLTTALGSKQPLDADLTSIAGLTSAADKMPYATGAGTWALTTLTAAGRSLLDDADAATMRGTLSVYSQAEVGDPTTSFVTAFESALV